ncbi:MAG: proline--tRNA ligase [Leptospira sp.]|nr:proline--tRNA ligase [Leptospira sp.]
MKASNYILPTAKEDPADAVVASHKLMIRAGLVRKSSAGLYNYLPMGLRVLRKIEKIIREEMDASGALEFELPILTPAELWIESGRWELMGKEMFRQKDRHDAEYSLGPTHEESFTSLLKPILKSYKDLPVNVYQIRAKFRDEIRPRFGVIRSREFTMKDAYSFHPDDASLNLTYELMRKVYRKIFSRCGLNTIPVQADSGSMGGSGSEEFMVISPIGEETLALCEKCGYSGNVEKTQVIFKNSGQQEKLSPYEKISTPGKKTINEVAEFTGTIPENTIKSVMYKSDNKENIIVFIRGDREVNEVKLKNFLKSLDLRTLSNEECNSIGCVPGFTGPTIPEKKEYKIIFDTSINPQTAYVTGANETDFHLKFFVPGRDMSFKPETIDLSLASKNDPCPNCSSPLDTQKGIEVGHIFKLGDKYTKAFDFKVSDKNGKQLIPIMGTYGIGVNRTMATIIEQSNDSKGIVWPISVSPFEVSLVSITKGVEELSRIEKIYQYLVQNGIDVFWDDRDLGPGFKFKDSEIVGFPVRLTLGKNFFQDSTFSILNRKSGEEKTSVFLSNEKLLEEINILRKELFFSLEKNN